MWLIKEIVNILKNVRKFCGISIVIETIDRAVFVTHNDVIVIAAFKSFNFKFYVN